MNYFEFYNIPLSFAVDKDALRITFLKNSKTYHPDFYTLESQEKQDEVLQFSTLNNEAYKTLSDFDKRMKYLLQLKGVLAEEGQNSIPQAFLMEMMELNEALMELEFDFDQATFEKTINSIEAIELEQFNSIATLIETYSGETATESELNKIKDYYLKKRYLLRIRENLNKFAAQ